jgi:hypothetical protein
VSNQEANARSILLRLAANFPALVLDEKECQRIGVLSSVDGAELTEWITDEFHWLVSSGNDRAFYEAAISGTTDER